MKPPNSTLCTVWALCILALCPLEASSQDLQRHGQITRVEGSELIAELDRGWTVDTDASGQVFEEREGAIARIAEVIVRRVDENQVVCEITRRSSTMQIDAGDPVNFTGAMREQQSVAVSSTPASIVYLNGRRIGRTPQELNVSPGQYTIRLSRQGYQPFERDVEVGYGRPPSLNADLIPYPGRLILRSNPDSAIVFIDGRRITELTPLERSLPPGTYRIEARKAGYQAVDQTVTIGDQDRRVNLTLPRARGRLLVRSTPEEARILVGNELLGTTPDTLELERGTYQVQVRKLGYEPFRQFVEVLDSLVMVEAGLEQAGVHFPVRSDPAGATIFVDGERIATAPDTVRLVPGAYDIRLEREGYESWNETVEVDQSPTPLEVTLREAPGILVISSEPNGATVYVDSTKVGTTTAVLQQLAPGPYEIHLTKPGYRTVERVVPVLGEVGRANRVNIELEPDVEQGRTLDYYMRRGRALREAGNNEKAIRYFEQALRVSPDYDFAEREIQRTQFEMDKEGWRIAAQDYVDSKSYDEARKYVEDILKVYPVDPQATQWKRLIENRLAVHASRPKFALRRENFNFKTVPLLGDVLNGEIVESPESLRFARNVSGIAFQYWGKSDNQGLFGLKMGFYNPNFSALLPGDQVSAYPYQSILDVDMKLGWYPVQSEWGNVGLFIGPGVMAINTISSAWRFVPSAPFGITIQVFPMRRLVLPSSVPNFPLSRLGLEFTSMYKWALPTEMDLTEGQTGDVSFSRTETGFAIIFRL